MPTKELKHSLKTKNVNLIKIRSVRKMSKIITIIMSKKHREYVDNASKAKEHMLERSLEED